MLAQTAPFESCRPSGPQKNLRFRGGFSLVGATGLLRLLRVFRAEHPFLKTLPQTCLLAGSNPAAPIDTKKPPLSRRLFFGRGDRIRTCDPLVPNQVR